MSPLGFTATPYTKAFEDEDEHEGDSVAGFAALSSFAAIPSFSSGIALT